ncbi:MAG: MFS transporter [Reyranella sp.]|nr:MFS transporter [Reyranella sp.]
MGQSSRIRLIAAGTIGNVLEWYDFAIYGYFAVSIGQNFFPSGDPVAQVLAAFGVFAAGFVMRPLGGLVTGLIGDRYGRRTALTVSVAAMAVPTFLVGALPNYEAIGIAAPILLTLLRMIQGLSVGGECTTSFTFLVENAPPGRAGLTGAIAMSGANLGLFAGSASGALMANLLPVEALHDWGWRIPFLAGVLVGGAGYFLRRHIQETNQPTHSRTPVTETFRNHKRLLLRIAGLAAFGTVSFFLMFLYVVSWLQLVDGVAPERALDINSFSMAALIPTMVAAGWLSDRIGRKPLLIFATVSGFIGAVPFMWLMHHPDPLLIVLGQLGFVIVLAPALAAQPALLVESTPPAVRCTVISLGFNASAGMLGGFAPLAAAWLVHRSGIDLSPAFIAMAVAVISFVAVLTFRETNPRQGRR